MKGIKMIRILLPLLMLSSPLAAHVGPHLHPHGNDPTWMVALLGILVVGAVTLYNKSRR